QFFGAHRYHERRATGRKGASPAFVLRGAVQLVAYAATRLRPFTGEELAPDQTQSWQELRQRLETRRQQRTHRRRFRCVSPTARGGLTPADFAALEKNGGHAAQALGRSRGGLSTKIHAGCRDERTGVAIVLTAGHCHESPVFETVLAQVPPEPSLTHALMDKG